MKFTKDDVFIVSGGRSVKTARRGMAHAGGRITFADVNSEDPGAIFAAWIDSEKVTLCEETRKKVEVETVIKKRKVKEKSSTVFQDYLAAIAAVKSIEDLEAFVSSIGEASAVLVLADTSVMLEQYEDSARELNVSLDYAIKRKGRKAALRVLDTTDAARDYLSGMSDRKGVYVEPRVRK